MNTPDEKKREFDKADTNLEITIAGNEDAITTLESHITDHLQLINQEDSLLGEITDYSKTCKPIGTMLHPYNHINRNDCAWTICRVKLDHL